MLLAACLGVGVGVSGLLQFTLGPFMEPLSREFGWTRAEIGGAGLAKSVGLLLVSVFVGALADRYGARRIALTSQALLAAGLLAFALMPGSLWLFYAGYALLVIVGAGTLQMTWSRAIVGWFTAGRGTALGIAMMGTGLVGALTPAYVTWLIDQFGWRGAYVGLALLPVVLGLPTTYLFFREPPKSPAAAIAQHVEPETGWTFRDAMRTRAFWFLSLSFFIGTIGVLGTLVHAIPMLTDRGIDRGSAAMLAGLFGLCVGLGRLVTGPLLDVLDPERVIAALFLLPATACVVLLFAGDSVVLCGIGLALVGFAGGVEGDAGGFLVARYFGRAHYGAIYGLLVALAILGGGTGPILIGYGLDATGSYDLPLMVGVGLFLLTAVLIYNIKPPRDPAVPAA